MNPYSVFATYYDSLTKDVDYPKRAEYLKEIFKKHSLNPEIILDLACGTGSMSLELAKAGYEIIGVDISPHMLSEAAAKAGSINGKAMFICQDISQLDLYGTVDAVICCLDSINHITSLSKLTEAFKRVSLFLNPDGLFIFDINTEYKLKEILGNNIFVYDTDEVYCVWQNSYNARSKTCDFGLTFFEPDGESFLRSDEFFKEKVYSDKTMKRLLNEAGLILEAQYNELSFDKPDDKCEREVFVARKG